MPDAYFALEPAGRFVDGEFAVYPNSILFEAGDYIDGAGQHFSMTPQELQTTVAGFQPVGGNIWHKDFLKGRAAVVRRVWTDDGGSRLRGEVAVPLGLDLLLEADEKRLSCEFGLADKMLTGIALTRLPIYQPAALMSAANAGAARQENTMESNDNWILNMLRSVFGPGAAQPEPATPPLAPPEQSAFAQDNPALAALESENQRLRQEREEERRQATRTFAASALSTAVQRADALIGKAFQPQVRPQLIALFARNLSRAQHSTATFSLGDAPSNEPLLEQMPAGVTFSLDGGAEGGDLALLEAIFSAVMPQGLLSETMPVQSYVLSSDRAMLKPSDDEEINRLLGLGPVGRAELAARSKS
jgi:hypothetical protein